MIYSNGPADCCRYEFVAAIAVGSELAGQQQQLAKRAYASGHRWARAGENRRQRCDASSKLGVGERRVSRGPPIQKESHDRAHCTACAAAVARAQHPCCLGFIWLPPHQSISRMHSILQRNDGLFFRFSRNYCDRSDRQTTKQWSTGFTAVRVG